ncbi:MAG: PAS domain S-box protein, partial [Cypionkella sp.]
MLKQAKGSAAFVLRVPTTTQGDLIFAVLWHQPPALSDYQRASLLLAGQTLVAAAHRWQTARDIAPNLVDRLARVVHVSKNLIALIDLDHRIEWVNPAFEQQTGWDLASIKGLPLASLTRADDSDPETIARLTEALAQNQPFQGEMLNKRRNGETYWVEFNVLPVHDSNDQPLGFVTIETDVTAERQQRADLRDMAAAATAARNRLSNALGALPDGVVILDDANRVVIANPAYRKMFPELAYLAHEGTHISELLIAGVQKGVFVDGIDDAAKQEWLKQRLQAYGSANLIDELALPDGRWIRRINQRTEDGGCIAVGIDITARKAQIAELDKANLQLTRALAARENAEQRMRNVVLGTGVGTWEYDIHKQTVRTGGEYARILGLDSEPLAVMTTEAFEAMLHPDDRRSVIAPTSNVSTASDEMFEIEFRMRHSDGNWRWVLSRGRVAARDANGQASMLVGVHMDITAQKSLQQELQISRDFLENMMETSVLALLVTDETSKIIYANAEADQIFDLPQGGLIGLRNGSPNWELQQQDGSPMPLGGLPSSQALRAGTQVRDIVYSFKHSNGTRRTISANAAPMTGIDGSKRAVVTFSDITDQVDATKNLHDALTRAEEANRAKSVFLANMSHEIRTPLNGVLGMTEVLETTLTDPAHQRMVAMIRSSGETLLTVLNNILDMSKIEAGKLSLENIVFQPAELMRQSEALFSLVSQEKGLAMECLSSGKLSQQRLGDPHRIQQILNNLVHNAIKFTETGTISLILSAKPGRPFVIEVSDTGCGLTQDQVERMFNSFEQADGSITRRFGGTGLGLSIVKDLVRLMDGSIEVDSTPDQGTTFRVSLPLQEVDSVAEPVVPPRPADLAETVLDNRRFLVADDNTTNRMVIMEMLSGSGATVVMVENGQLAIEAWEAALAEAKPFDVLLLDITMPVLDGVSALAEIRRR